MSGGDPMNDHDAMDGGAPMGDDALVLAARTDGVLRLTLNRPERLNAWTSALGERLFDRLDAADRDPAVRVIVLTGAGRGFCPGADFEELERIDDPAAAARPARRVTSPLTLRKPTIAAVNGACAGLGLALALACDVRFGARGARFSTAFARRGLVAEHGTSWLLPRIVGHARALDLLLSARVVEAEEALRIGLLHELSDATDVVDDAMAYAHDLAANCSPRSMAVIRRQVATHPALPLDDAMDDTEDLTERSLSWPDLAEGVRSHVERRPPRFDPLPTTWSAR